MCGDGATLACSIRRRTPVVRSDVIGLPDLCQIRRRSKIYLEGPAPCPFNPWSFQFSMFFGNAILDRCRIEERAPHTSHTPSNFTPNLAPKSVQDRQKSHSKSIQNRILLLIPFFIQFWLIFYRFSTPNQPKIDQKFIIKSIQEPNSKNIKNVSKT